MIRITHLHERCMAVRGVPCLEGYFTRVRMDLWPRFKTIFDMNLASVRNANPAKLGTIDLHPHYVVKRFSEFLVAISVLQSTFEANTCDEMVPKNLTTLRVEMDKLLNEMARISSLKKKEHGVFFINNYDQILTTFSERRISTTESVYYQNQLQDKVTAFIEEELNTHYGKDIYTYNEHHSSLSLTYYIFVGRLIDFVKQTEPLFADSTGAVPTLNEEVLHSIVRDFSVSWKKGIESINSSVLKYFSNFKNGTDILKQVLTQLTMYYARFQDIIKKSYPRKPPPFAKDVVAIPTIMQEIRKFSRSFE